MKIYIVQGSSATEECSWSWNIKAFSNKNDAVALSEFLDGIISDYRHSLISREAAFDMLKEHDKAIETKHYVDFESSYALEEIELD